jgi:hypothetical protein
MHNAHGRQWICLHKLLEILPREAFALTTTVQPFEHDPDSLMYEVSYPSRVMRHTVVLYVPSYLRDECPPHFPQREHVSLSLDPSRDLIELRPYSFGSRPSS